MFLRLLGVRATPKVGHLLQSRSRMEWLKETWADLMGDIGCPDRDDHRLVSFVLRSFGVTTVVLGGPKNSICQSAVNQVRSLAEAGSIDSK